MRTKFPRSKAQRSKADVLREIESLEPLVALWNFPGFQEFLVRPVDAAVAKLSDSEWCLTNEGLRVLLAEIGVSQPQAAGDLLTLFLCARSVVASWEKRLRPFREAERILDSLKKELSTWQK